MILLRLGNSNELMFLVVLAFLFWAIPIVMLIIGLIRLRSKPNRGKRLMIIAGIWLLAGLGFCASLR